MRAKDSSLVRDAGDPRQTEKLKSPAVGQNRPVPAGESVQAAEFPYEVLRQGGCVIEVNPDPSELTPAATHSLRGPGGAVLVRLLEHVKQRVAPAPESSR